MDEIKLIRKKITFLLKGSIKLSQFRYKKTIKYNQKDLFLFLKKIKHVITESDFLKLTLPVVEDSGFNQQVSPW